VAVSPLLVGFRGPFHFVHFVTLDKLGARLSHGTAGDQGDNVDAAPDHNEGNSADA
jgi:hypothetical protein